MNLIQLPVAGNVRKTCFHAPTCEPLLTEKSKLDAFIEITLEHTGIELNRDFAFRVYNVLTDNAFCKEKNVWYELRIVKELNFYVEHYGYGSLETWCKFSDYLPTPFLTKEEAEEVLKEVKTQELKQMILRSARNIHAIFYQITLSEVDTLIPFNLIDKLTMEKVFTLEPFIDLLVLNQSKTTLSNNGFTTWESWEKSLTRNTLAENRILKAV